MKTWRTWTQKEDDRLRDLRAAGVPMPEIARLMARPISSIKNRVQQEGCERPSLAYRRLSSRWYAAFRKPHTIRGLAEQMGVTVWAVKQAKRKLRRMGLDIPDAQGKGGRE